MYDPCVKKVIVVNESSNSEKEHNSSFNMKYNTDYTSVQKISEDSVKALCTVSLQNYLFMIHNNTNKRTFIILD